MFQSRISKCCQNIFGISLILKFISLGTQICKQFKNSLDGSKAAKVLNFITRFNSVVEEKLCSQNIYKKRKREKVGHARDVPCMVEEHFSVIMHYCHGTEAQSVCDKRSPVHEVTRFQWESVCFVVSKLNEIERNLQRESQSTKLIESNGTDMHGMSHAR